MALAGHEPDVVDHADDPPARVEHDEVAMPWSSIARNASSESRSAPIVTTGDVMTRASGVSGPAPAATTRVRRSRSVTMPISSPRSTSTHAAPSRAMSRAASRTPSVGAQISGGRISVSEAARAT